MRITDRKFPTTAASTLIIFRIISRGRLRRLRGPDVISKVKIRADTKSRRGQITSSVFHVLLDACRLHPLDFE